MFWRSPFLKPPKQTNAKIAHGKRVSDKVILWDKTRLD